jgi:DNA-binding HxlR family transcriptional regulator
VQSVVKNNYNIVRYNRNTNSCSLKENPVPTTRSYQDACGIARALDVVGERWALLVVRELLFGPQRYSELRQSLPMASSNVVADRLRELEANGVVQRRRLSPPSASWVYELTPRGRELEPIVLALGGWGLQFPRPDTPVTLSPVSVLLYWRGCARPDPSAAPSMVQVQLDDRPWTVRAADGRFDVQAGDTSRVDAVIRSDPATLNDLIGAPSRLRAAIRSGAAEVQGDEAVVRRLLQQVETA